MLKQLGTWAKNRVSRMASETPLQAQHAAQVKRETRARTVTELQARVRHLQQQITDLTAGEGRTSGQEDRDQLADLEAQLAVTQAELSRYEGRI